MSSNKRVVWIAGSVVLVLVLVVVALSLHDPEGSVDEQNTPIDTSLQGEEIFIDLEQQQEERRQEEEAREVEEAVEEAAEEVPITSYVPGEVDTSAWDTYSNIVFDYGFKVPSDWYKHSETTADSWVATYSSFPPEQATNPNELPGAQIDVLVQQNVEGRTLQELTDEVKVFASSVQEEQILTLGTQDATLIAGDLPERTFVVTALRGEDIVTITFSGDEVDVHRSTLDGVIQSFSL